MENFTLKNFGRWNVRIVRQNDRYGLNDCLVHEESDPLIEFYDNNYKNDGEWKRGQFVSRYYAGSLFERCYDHYKWGLQLDGGIPVWYVSPHEMAEIYRWLREQLPQYQFTAKQLSDLNYLREKEHLEADRIQNALARPDTANVISANTITMKMILTDFRNTITAWFTISNTIS